MKISFFRQGVLPLVMVFSVCMASAQESKWQHALTKVKNAMVSYAESGIDSNYLVYPERRLMVRVGGKNLWSGHKIYLPFSYGKDGEERLHKLFPGIENYEYIKIKSSASSSGVAVDVNYVGFSAGYTFNVSNRGVKYSFEIGSSGNSFGFMLGTSRNHLKEATVANYLMMPLYIEMFMQKGEPYDLKEIAKKFVVKGDDDMIDVVNWYAGAYYAFNGRRFSMSSTLSPDIIQRRSAGSFFVTADVNYTRLHTKAILEGDMEKFNSFLIGVGGGYGYNWTPDHGRLVVHASMAPMISAYSRLSHSAYDEGKKMPEYESLKNINDKRMKLTVFGRANFGLSYNFSDRFVGGLYTQYIMRRSKNASDAYMKNWNLLANVYFGCRF
mgnify:CR=1 FL=1